MKVCWFCGTEYAGGPRPSRDVTCAKCRMSLKCCKNCAYFDPAAHNQCRDRAAEWVRDKELANFCEFFEFREGTGKPSGGRSEEARRKLDDLFKR